MTTNEPPTDASGWKTTPPDAQALLAPFRRRIDALDDRIVALLGERFAIVRQVAALKAEHGIHPVLADRLEQVVDQAKSHAERAGFDPDVAERIYRVLLDAACRLETDLIPSDRAAGP
jgi:chorismate mutase